MKINFLLLFFTLSSYSGEITLNSREKTILSFADNVIATNCSPHSLGNITAIQGFQAPPGQQILQFTPFGIQGTVVCSAKTKSHGVISVKFLLKRGVNNPIIEIPLTDKKQEVQNIFNFKQFIQGETSQFSKIKSEDSFETKNFRYEVSEKFQASAYFYFYKILVRPDDRKVGFIRLDNSKLSPIIFSHHKDLSLREIPGLSQSKSSYLYLMTNGSVKLRSVGEFLR